MRFWNVEYAKFYKCSVSVSSLTRSVPPELAETQLLNWAKVESFTLAKQQAYQNGKLMGSSDLHNGKVLPPNYATTIKPIAERRIVLSGYRIADLLDRLF